MASTLGCVSDKPLQKCERFCQHARRGAGAMLSLLCVKPDRNCRSADRPVNLYAPSRSK